MHVALTAKKMVRKKMMRKKMVRKKMVRKKMVRKKMSSPTCPNMNATLLVLVNLVIAMN